MLPFDLGGNLNRLISAYLSRHDGPRISSTRVLVERVTHPRGLLSCYLGMEEHFDYSAAAAAAVAPPPGLL